MSDAEPVGRTIRVAIVGVGNCASALVQGIGYYRRESECTMDGLSHRRIGSWECEDIELVAAFDIDARKVGLSLSEAIFAPPNCAVKFFSGTLPGKDVFVQKGPVADGVAPHMKSHPSERAFRTAPGSEVSPVEVLRKHGVNVLINFLPVGSEAATRLYAEACLHARCAMVNCIPSFVASDTVWSDRFRVAGVPIVGDDIKSQLGATIVHRMLARLFSDRGIRIRHTYQLNTGGNTDFLNMLSRERLASKRLSKTRAVQSQLKVPLEGWRVHIGPSDYVEWQNDNKVCFLRIEGSGFGAQPIHLELRLSVEDSPNSAGVVVDAIRCAALAFNRGLSGAIEEASAWLMKSPPTQLSDAEAKIVFERFIRGTGR